MKSSRLSLTVRGAAGLACLVLLAGCGGNDSSASGDSDSSSSSAAGSSSAASTGSSSTAPSDSESASSSTAPSPASIAQGADFAALSGQEISDSAKAEMLGLQAVHYQGDIADSSGDITLDVQAKADGDCTGTVGIQGGTATVLSASGQSWFKGDRKFWKAAAGASANKIIKAVGTKWVVDTNQDFAQFCSLSQFLNNLFDSSGTSTYSPKGTTQLGGQDVVAVERTSGTQTPTTGYVLTTGQHYLVKIERSAAGKQGTLTFSDFDQSFEVTAPDPSDTVDPSTLG